MKSKTQDLFALTAISLMTTASVSAAPTVIGLKAQNGDVLCIQNDYHN